MPSAKHVAKNQKPDIPSLNASAFRSDAAASTELPKVGVPRSAKPAELMSPEEFQAAFKRGLVREATGHYTDAEQKAETQLVRGEAACYSPDDIAAFYVARRGGDWRLGAYDLVKDAYAEKRPVNASLWDAVVVRAPRGYVRDGEVYRPRRMPPVGFVARKIVTIPVWAKVITLVANGIDGRPPVSDGVYSVEQFIKVAEEAQHRQGAGEWDVLVYAMDDPNAALEVYPYGRDNPYRRLRRTRGHRVKQIARFSYGARQNGAGSARIDGATGWAGARAVLTDQSLA
jgi:hypothetical protein